MAKNDPSLRWGLIALSLLIAGLLFFFSIPRTVSYENILPPEVYASTSSTPIEEPVQPEPQPPEPPTWKYPQLKRICSCESTGRPGNEPRHYAPDGSVLRGKINSLDTGMCQINLYYHGDAALALGLDLFDPVENRLYATYLYEREGSQPWYPSAHCWNASPQLIPT